MFIQFNCICLIILAGVFAQAQNVPAPKYYIGITPAEDRWVTLTEGKVFQGVEISYLLGQKLLDSGKFIPVLTSAPSPQSVGSIPGQVLAFEGMVSSMSNPERLAQIPAEWTQWLKETPVSLQTAMVGSNSSVPIPGSIFLQEMVAPALPTAPYSLVITPIVDTLIYSSGSRSDRVVFGFSPDHLNPFNQGRTGALDNEFVATSDQAKNCSKPDFFNGEFKPSGWGPFSSVYGSDFDQGVTFNILGQGFSFKRIAYQVVNQIRFEVDDIKSGAHQELIFNETAKGSDVLVWGAYNGFSLSIDIQRRTTLLDALQKLLPQVVDDLINQRFSGPWMSDIISISGSTLQMGAGLNENVQQGLQVISPDGDVFQVTYSDISTATLEKISGPGAPFVGEPLQAFFGQPVTWPTTTVMAPHLASAPSAPGRAVARRMAAQSSSGQNFFNEIEIIFDDLARALVMGTAIKGCVDHKLGWLESMMDSLFIPYGFYRYAEVFDQAAKPQSSPTPTQEGVLRIALIDSGVDVKDSKISKSLAFSGTTLQGFDFISWDTRPSDDNGHGTAAAKLLLKLVKKPVSLLSAKVVGPQGETHSSAIYDAFNFAVQSKVDAILVPWSSIPSTMTAYISGAELAASHGIPVFVPSGVPISSSNVFFGSGGTKGFKTSGLDASLRIGPEGVSTVQALAQWINSK